MKTWPALRAVKAGEFVEVPSDPRLMPGSAIRTRSESIARYDPFSLMRLPEFWRGAAAVRSNGEDDRAGLVRVHRLEAIAVQRRDPTQSDDFRDWLAYSRRSPL